jgi:hypothetical protein
MRNDFNLAPWFHAFAFLIESIFICILRKKNRQNFQSSSFQEKEGERRIRLFISSGLNNLGFRSYLMAR